VGTGVQEKKEQFIKTVLWERIKIGLFILLRIFVFSSASALSKL